VTAEQVDDYGAFNVSLINDLPLFIDPFLLFNSSRPEYRKLHGEILRYMIFLRDKVATNKINPDLVKAWFMFPEVKQNWLGFSLHGNGGSGLGKDFAEALILNLESLFADFGQEKITKSSHIEKVCLVRGGVGRDMICDFTTNLLKDYLCQYTERFATAHINPALRRKMPVNKAVFNYETEAWERRTYDLPWADDFVLLTPKDMLTRDENWINRTDMIRDFENIPVAIPDAELRGQVFNYFQSMLVRLSDRRITQREKDEAAIRTIMQFPELVDYYIKNKENSEMKPEISAQKRSTRPSGLSKPR
jgi:hypothetical protein